MINKLKKASNIFWIVSAVSFLCSLTGCVFIRYHKPGLIHEIGIVDFLMVIPDLFLALLSDSFYEPAEFALSCVLLMIPIIFASLAISLRFIAKALEERADS